ncbi:MAG: tRNA (N6-isopentenyl adenosine(37)-C2)-methylthiotransferase MiaB [Pseudomonadota bacterium]
MNHSVFIKTIGCQMNHADSDIMAKMLLPLGYLNAERYENADLILVNTCAIREKAEHKAFSFIGKLLRLKKKRPDLMIGIGGCLAQQEGKRIFGRAPHVDFVFGTEGIFRLPQLISRSKSSKNRVIDINITGAALEHGLSETNATQNHVTAFVTIIRGCDNFCSYCVVPYTRGREVSRAPSSILNEIIALVQSGVREVTLLGQNVNSYGKKGADSCSFPDLLEIVNKIDGLERIRFTTSHPKDISDNLIDHMASLEKICPHIHLPVQSGSDHILRLMNRRYTVKNYLDKVERLRKAVPGIAITSDIIIGFPEETEEDFQATCSVVRQVEYDSIFLFNYSDRPNVASASLVEKVSEEEKQRRFNHLMQIQESITLNKNQLLVNAIRKVLIEGKNKSNDEQMTGRTPCNKIVHIKNNSSLTPGKCMPIIIKQANKHSLAGELISEA